MATIKNVIKKIKAILGFHGVSDSELLKAGNTAYDGLLKNVNAAFPNPPVPLPVFRQALDSFSALIVDAEDGGKKSISAKNKQRTEVIRLYALLGHYVEATCNNLHHQRLYGKVHHKDGAAGVGTGEVQFARPRPEQRTNRCEGRKSDRRHCLRSAFRTRRHGRRPWSLDRDDVDQPKKGDHQWPHAGRNLPVPGPRAG